MIVNRRAFIAAGGAAAAGILVGTPLHSGAAVIPEKNLKGRVTIYRLSLRGRRGSRFALQYNANMRFITARVAHLRRAHPGDRSRIVPLTISTREYHRLFISRRAQFADLRLL